MNVDLTIEQDALPVEPGALRDEIEELAGRAGWTGRLSVVLVTDAKIRELNRRFLDRDEPTDVLAFPLEPDQAEVVVSAERALAVAKERGVAPGAELMLYIVHGILHLTGHDDHDPTEARRMHARALRLLRSAGHRNRITPRKRARGP